MKPDSMLDAFAREVRGFIQLRSGQSAAPTDPASEPEFDRLALSLFELQLTHNSAYRRFCEAQKLSPQNVEEWRKIPAIPTAAFKELELTCLKPAARTHFFHSSGTTAQARSRHFHNRDSLSVYDASLMAGFRAHFPNAISSDFIILTPSLDNSPNSSLVHMFETLRLELKPKQAVFTGTLNSDGAWDADQVRTIEGLRAAAQSGRPVTLLGAAFNFVIMLDHLVENDLRFQLPASSCVLETGGYKSRSRVLPKAKLHSLITERLGIPAANLVCEYGMSELSSQAYNGIAGARSEERSFRFPPWARAQIISPETGREVAEGETGLIRVFDLANVYSVMAIQTEDLGVRRGDGFDLLGRAALAEARGCSLMSI